MHREVMHESRPEQQQQKAFGNRVVPTVGYIDTSIYYCCKSIPVLLHNVMVGRWITSYVFILFERSEFLIDTSQKKKTSVCVCSTNLGFSVGYATILGFSVGYVLCTYVPGISRQKSHHVRSIAW